jgi:hypothetical protein
LKNKPTYNISVSENDGIIEVIITRMADNYVDQMEERSSDIFKTDEP